MSKVKCVKAPQRSKNVVKDQEYDVQGMFNDEMLPVSNFEDSRYLVVVNANNRPTRYRTDLFIPVAEEVILPELTTDALLDSISFEFIDSDGDEVTPDFRDDEVTVGIVSELFQLQVDEFIDISQGIDLDTTVYALSCGIITVGNIQSLYDSIMSDDSIIEEIERHYVLLRNIEQFKIKLFAKVIRFLIESIRTARVGGFALISTVDGHPSTEILRTMSDTFEFISSSRRNHNSSNNILMFVANIG